MAGLLSKFKDHFTTADFNVAPNKKVKTNSDAEVKLRGSMTVEKVENLFDEHFGLTTQIKGRFRVSTGKT